MSEKSNCVMDIKTELECDMDDNGAQNIYEKIEDLKLELDFRNVSTKPEPADSDEVMEKTELYRNHEIKEEMVIGPEELQQLSCPSPVNMHDKNHGVVATNTSGQCLQQYVDRSTNCSEKFTKFLDLDRHLQLQIQNSNSKKFFFIEERRPTCNVCGLKFTTTKHLKQHLRTHVIKCKNINTAKKQLHQNAHDRKKQSYVSCIFVCNICHKRFNDKNILENHLHIHDKETQARDTCKETFDGRITYKRLKCPGETDKSQHQINRGTGGPTSTKVKQKTKEVGEEIGTAKMFLCNICHKMFDDKNKLQNHFHTHDKETKTCDSCKETFSHRITFVRHKCPGETDQPQHQINRGTGGLTFTEETEEVGKEKVNRRRRNTDPFGSNCRICKKKNCILHARRALSGSFKCNVCNDRFSSQKHLTLHMLVHDIKEKMFNNQAPDLWAQFYRR